MKISRLGTSESWGLDRAWARFFAAELLAWSDFSERYTISMRHTGATGMLLSALTLLLNMTFGYLERYNSGEGGL